MRLTDQTVRHLAAHVGSQEHVMAGSTAAISGALACAVGESCVRISAPRLDVETEQAQAGSLADRLAEIREQLLELADEDAAVIAHYMSARLAGQEPEGVERLSELQVEIGRLVLEAGFALQDFRPLVRHVPDDLEISIALLQNAVRAASMVLDSNLHIWTEPDLVARFDPQLAELRGRLQGLQPADRFR